MNKAGTAKSQMIRFYGAVIRVRNIDRSRAFYCNVLRLGAPVISTNFWVEFEVVPGQMVLALQQNNNAAECPQAEKGDIQWCLWVKDIEEFRRHLRSHGVQASPISSMVVGKEFFTFRDLEGNPLMAIADGKDLNP